MQRTKLRNRITLTAILAFIVFNLGMLVVQAQQKQPAQLLSATVLSQPRELSSFKLMDSKNKPFTNQNLLGHWTMLYFGFTRCPQICPNNMAMLNKMYTKLQENKQQPLPHVVFVSIDPDRDSLTRIGQFVAAFNPNFEGVTGSTAQVDKMMQELGVVSMKVQKQDPTGKVAAKDNYDIDHSGAILLIDPAGKFYAVFTTPHDAANIAQDFQTINNSPVVSYK